MLTYCSQFVNTFYHFCKINLPNLAKNQIKIFMFNLLDFSKDIMYTG